MFDSGLFSSESFSPDSWFGLESAVAPALQQVFGGGPSWIAPPNNYPKKQTAVEVEHQKRIARQRAEDEMMLEIIVMAVTKEMIH